MNIVWLLFVVVIFWCQSNSEETTKIPGCELKPLSLYQCFIGNSLRDSEIMNQCIRAPLLRVGCLVPKINVSSTLVVGCLEKTGGCGCGIAGERSFFLDFCSTLRQGKVEKKFLTYYLFRRRNHNMGSMRPCIH